MSLKYSDKHYLIPSSTWEKLRDGAVGGPQLSLKKTYQDFMERQRAEENQTDQKWSALSKRVTPILDQVINRSKSNTALEQSLLIDKLKPKAKSLYQSLEKISGVEIDWAASKIYVDNHPLVGNITTILKQLVTKRDEDVRNLIPLLRKLYPIRNKIDNEAALNWINAHAAPPPRTPSKRRGKGSSAQNSSKGKAHVRNLNESLFSPADHENTPGKNQPRPSIYSPPARRQQQQQQQKSNSEPPARQRQKSRIPEPSDSGSSSRNNRANRHNPRKTPKAGVQVKFELPEDDDSMKGSGRPPGKKRKQISWKSLF